METKGAESLLWLILDGAISLFLFGLNQSVLSVPGTEAHEGDMDPNSTAKLWKSNNGLS